jgi:hypothetical protein
MTYSQLRASDAERERVVAFLREHALLGRLNDEELEERIGSAYSAVTVGDLERLIADLPRGRQPVARPHHAAARRGVHPGLIAAGVLAIVLTGLPFAALGIGVAIIAVMLATVLALSFVLGPLILIALVIVAASKRRRHPPAHWRTTY